MKFVSRRGHKGLDQSRRDDLESWLFSVIDIFDQEGLPWTREKTRNAIYEKKREFFKAPESRLTRIRFGFFFDIKVKFAHFYI